MAAPHCTHQPEDCTAPNTEMDGCFPALLPVQPTLAWGLCLLDHELHGPHYCSDPMWTHNTQQAKTPAHRDPLLVVSGPGSVGAGSYATAERSIRSGLTVGMTLQAGMQLQPCMDASLCIGLGAAPVVTLQHPLVQQPHVDASLLAPQHCCSMYPHGLPSLLMHHML